jgi:hypothetical protein
MVVYYILRWYGPVSEESTASKNQLVAVESLKNECRCLLRREAAESLGDCEGEQDNRTKALRQGISGQIRVWLAS